MVDQSQKSAPALVGDLVQNVNELFRKEVQLLRAETSEKTTQAASAVGLIVGGVVVVLVALNVLAFALVAALENAGLGAGWAALAVGGTFAVIAFLLVGKGVNNLKASNLAPSRTAGSVAKDVDVVKGAAS